MIKPRIVIADTDYGYVVPLQHKFILELFDQVELEVITSPTYLQQFFASPQKIDVLVIAEELYNSSVVRKHNIKSVFVMTEQVDSDKDSYTDAVSIYKYSSVKEIYSELTVPIGQTFQLKKDGLNEPKVILVTSAIGGAGKTTVAMGVSAGLSKAHKRVLYIDAEKIQAFQFRMSNAVPITGNDIYSELVKPGNHAYMAIRHLIRKETFSYIPPFKAALSSLGLNDSVYVELVKEAKKSGDYDYIVIDSDHIFNDLKAEMINSSDYVIFITKQDLLSVKTTNNYVSNLNGLTKDKYLFVCNDFDEKAPNELLGETRNLLFTVSEYIRHFSDDYADDVSGLGEISNLQKIAYLYV